jgi:DNA-binding PadR family transcriptional regulator
MTNRTINTSGVSVIRSPLAWALLGLVIERPSYGYELAHRFQRVYGDTLVLSNTLHVYRLLETLSSHALIEEVKRNDFKPLRTGRSGLCYRASARGARAYKEWLVNQLEQERRRACLFTRELVMLEPEEALAVIEGYERECATTSAPVDDGAPHGSRRAITSAERLAGEQERLALRARLSWMKYARDELNALVENPPNGKQPGRQQTDRAPLRRTPRVPRLPRRSPVRSAHRPRPRTPT